MYEVFIERAAKKALARVEALHRNRILKAIEDLATDPRPRGATKLSGREAWRFRVGSYRVIYEIQDARLIVMVVTVGHRREIYRR